MKSPKGNALTSSAIAISDLSKGIQVLEKAWVNGGDEQPAAVPATEAKGVAGKILWSQISTLT